MSERQGQRIDAAVGVILRHGTEKEPCMSRGISAHGMAVGTTKRWPVGTAIELEIVHDSVRVKTRARIASHNKAGLGLEFLDESPEFHAQIEKLLAKFIPLQQGGARIALPAQFSGVRFIWSLPEEIDPPKWWKSRLKKAQLIDLSLDGAGIACKKPPDVGQKVLVVLALADSDEKDPNANLQCDATVVRHTERGFAVQFASPSLAFRKLVSDIRKMVREGA